MREKRGFPTEDDAAEKKAHKSCRGMKVRGEPVEKRSGTRAVAASRLLSVSNREDNGLQVVGWWVGLWVKEGASIVLGSSCCERPRDQSMWQTLCGGQCGVWRKYRIGVPSLPGPARSGRRAISAAAKATTAAKTLAHPRCEGRIGIPLERCHSTSQAWPTEVRIVGTWGWNRRGAVERGLTDRVRLRCRGKSARPGFSWRPRMYRRKQQEQLSPCPECIQSHPDTREKFLRCRGPASN